MLVKHIKSDCVPKEYHHPAFIPGHLYRTLDSREERYNLFLCVLIAGCNELRSVVTGKHIFKDSQRWEDVTDYYECVQIRVGEKDVCMRVCMECGYDQGGLVHIERCKSCNAPLS